MHLEPYQAQVELLKTIPGIKDLAAASIIAEVGVDMDQFKDELQHVRKFINRINA
jgi:transposase